MGKRSALYTVDTIAKTLGAEVRGNVGGQSSPKEKRPSGALRYSVVPVRQSARQKCDSRSDPEHL